MTMLAELQCETVQHHIPYTVIFELTRKCNLNCQHCYATPERGRKELTTLEIKNTIDQLRELGTLFITFTGGDPTVNPNFLEILRYTSEKNLAIQLFTNGIALKKNVVDELCKLNVFHVGVSVYGASAKTHDTITRVPGSWERTINACRRLKENGVFVVFKFVIMTLNINETDDMMRMSEKLGIPCKIDAKMKPRDDISHDALTLQASNDKLKTLYSTYKKEHIGAKTLGNSMIDLACVMGRSLLTINAYGDVFPCVQVPIPAGNIRYASIADIWENSPFLQEVRKFPIKEKMHGCPECSVREYCNRCPGSAFTEAGDIYGPSPSSCEEAVLSKEIVESKKLNTDELPPGLASRKHFAEEPIVWDRFGYFKKEQSAKEGELDGHLPGWEPYEIVHGGSECEKAEACGKPKKSIGVELIQQL